MKILLIDNYDSYTYNLKQYLENYPGTEVLVVKNDLLSKADIDQCDALVLSPGPGLPSSAGRLMESIAYASLTHPMLGVCLGHQAIAEFFGGQLLNLSRPYHGIQSDIEILDNENILFKNGKSYVKVGRYHSWVVDTQQFPTCLLISAVDKEGLVMALRHEHLPIWGVQFHPESILTPSGQTLVNNFLSFVASIKHRVLEPQ
jgi:anthranilate synthase component II